jgi:outer membrane protein TolC
MNPKPSNMIKKRKSDPKRFKAWLILILVSVTLIPFQGVFAQQATMLTIDSCYARAERNYPMIRQYALIEKSKEYTISNANKAWCPNLSITGIGAYIISGIPAISLPNSPPAEKKDLQFIGIGQLNQTIWDGGATHTQKEVAKASAAADRASVDVAMYEIRDRVNQLFFGILVIDAQMEQLGILVANLTRSLNSAKLTSENGLAYQSDVDEVKAELLNVKQREIEFLYARKGFTDMLSYITGTLLTETSKLEKPVVTENYLAWSNRRPELNLYARQLHVVEASSSFDKVAVMPKFGLMAAGILIEPGIAFGTETMNSLAIAGLSFTWNTSGLYKLSTNNKLNRIKEDRIQNQQEIFVFNNTLQLKQGSNEIEKQEEIIKTDDEIVMLKTRIKDAYQLKYDNGVCSMNDLINSINRESEAKRNQTLHQVQLLSNIYNYKAKTGN